VTNPNPDLPSAAEALAEAWKIARTPCSAAETARATLLFEIGRELRIAADMRTLNARRVAIDARQARSKLDAAGIPTPAAYEPTPVTGYAGEQATERYAAMMRPFVNAGQLVPDESAVTQLVPALADQTQRFPIVWAVGDKADCRHCHTPIMLCPRRMKDPLAVGEADVPAMWIHKYTDQRTCAVPTMSSDDDEPTHTFAEPAPR